MPNRKYPNRGQVFRGQPWQHFGVDVVIAERRLILFKPETAEPCRNVHARLPEAVNAALSPYFNLSLRENTRWGLSQRRSCGSGLRHGALTYPASATPARRLDDASGSKTPRQRHSPVRGELVRGEGRENLRRPYGPPTARIRARDPGRAEWRPWESARIRLRQCDVTHAGNMTVRGEPGHASGVREIAGRLRNCARFLGFP